MNEQYGQTFGQNQMESSNLRATDHVLGSGFDGLRSRYEPCLSVLTPQTTSEEQSKCHIISMTCDDGWTDGWTDGRQLMMVGLMAGN